MLEHVLAKWNHSDRGLLGLTPAAEPSELIPFGQNVL